MVKVAAVAITFGGRMGGGIFSPSLMVGALTGLALLVLPGPGTLLLAGALGSGQRL